MNVKEAAEWEQDPEGSSSQVKLDILIKKRDNCTRIGGKYQSSFCIMQLTQN